MGCLKLAYYEDQPTLKLIRGGKFFEQKTDTEGHLYVYVSNETPNVDVFFDNVQVSHSRGALVAENSYYPFGLTHHGFLMEEMNYKAESLVMVVD